VNKKKGRQLMKSHHLINIYIMKVIELELKKISTHD